MMHYLSVCIETLEMDDERYSKNGRSFSAQNSRFVLGLYIC